MITKMRKEKATEKKRGKERHDTKACNSGNGRIFLSIPLKFCSPQRHNYYAFAMLFFRYNYISYIINHNHHIITIMHPMSLFSTWDAL